MMCRNFRRILCIQVFVEVTCWHGPHKQRQERVGISIRMELVVLESQTDTVEKVLVLMGGKEASAGSGCYKHSKELQ
jgi:hypothetical protein